MGEELPDRPRKDMWFEFDLLPGAVRHAPARDLKALLSAPVIDERGVGVVKPTAVSLEDQPLVAPEEIRLQGATFNLQGDVDLRLGQADLKANVKEHSLELASTALGLGMNFIEEPAQAGHSPPSPSSMDLKAKLTVVDDPHGFRLPERLSQLPRRQGGREIQKRARDGGAGDTAKLSAV